MAKEKSLELTYEEQLEELSAREQAVSLREKMLQSVKRPFPGLRRLKEILKGNISKKAMNCISRKRIYLKIRRKS